MKKTILISTLMLGTVALAACEPNATTTVGSPNPTKPVKPIVNQNADYVGLTEEAAVQLAESRGARFRVVERDGQSLPITKDYIVGRINATVQNGIVVKYEIEGKPQNIPATPPATATDYRGLTESAAAQLAETRQVPFRVVKRDGEALAVTMDYRPGRINAEVEKGIVVNYQVE